MRKERGEEVPASLRMMATMWCFIAVLSTCALSAMVNIAGEPVADT